MVLISCEGTQYVSGLVSDFVVRINNAEEETAAVLLRQLASVAKSSQTNLLKNIQQLYVVLELPSKTVRKTSGSGDYGTFGQLGYLNCVRKCC